MENLDCKNIVNALEYVLMQVCGGSDLLRRKVFDLELERNAYKEVCFFFNFLSEIVYEVKHF